MGTFIVFEGGEGSGKSTQARCLYRRLRRQGHPGLLTHEPGGTVFGERVRCILKRGIYVTPRSWLFLFSAARTQLLEEVVHPALARGEAVVCDRYVPSTIAYQGYGHGLSLEMVSMVTEAATQGLRPDVVVLLDAPSDIGLKRRAGRGRDRFEAEALEFHRRVREGYLKQAKDEPERWLVVDATLPKERVAEVIWQRVEPLLRAR